ncbi:hypothetical protein BJF79_07605 [Actinomadura sp. CNU-125]|uniref:phytoene desaturase family protein n=1 Tax=Actinomadura sp. CNU-125 TaxID=1904961 RepID=UPI00095D2E17|nr:FAD-dependent oxidoreductase [Actinomadura sp. CNU-125]OLT33766.1 hypothetical protein BJF79_07605 [Actinomadura sp. CNU-125]
MADAVVVGAGQNGLVAANVLADAGWDVLVLEAQPEPGGAVRSDRGVRPDYVSDLCSAFYPLGVASPAMRALELERHGLRWRHAPAVLAHPLPDGRCAVLERDREPGVTWAGWRRDPEVHGAGPEASGDGPECGCGPTPRGGAGRGGREPGGGLGPGLGVEAGWSGDF